MLVAEQGDPNEPTISYVKPRPRGRWTPTWTFSEGTNPLGATVDDGCVVFLGQDAEGYWGPLTHIPALAIRFVQNLLAKTGTG